MENNLKVAVIGATGLVGRTVLKVLEEERFSNIDFYLFASSNSKNAKVPFLGVTYLVQELTESIFDLNFDYAIFCAGSFVAKKFIPIAQSKRCICIDNSSLYRMDPTVPLVVPEINPEELFNHNYIIANPNCSTIQAVMALKPLDINYTIRRIVYSTYQAVSGMGKKGLEDLENGQKGFLPKTSPYPLFNNCLPHIDIFEDDGYTKEEHKLINETRKILKKPTLPITATAVRVPVSNCHSESINITFEKDFNITDLKTTLQYSNGIVVLDDLDNNIYPTVPSAEGSNDVFVGRIRRDGSMRSGVNLWVVADNLRRGAASNAVFILAKLIELNIN